MSSRTARMSSGGRLVIPVDVRREIGLDEGVPVVLVSNQGVLTITTLAESVKQAQAIFAMRTRPNQSIVDELIADRRAAAKNGD